jgi:23S rRNA (cytidine1920-2'-O)/16S rRNA (cytidine1409-2'-O)-methyltransferase
VAQTAGISRERAQGLILAGNVSVDGVPQRKIGFAVNPGAAIDIAGEQRYVSRGGTKLEHALDEFGWTPQGLRCLDVGASTGGFTDCLLQHGALSVTAVDVGYGHLAWKLRQDPRVIVVERTNFRHADVATLGAPFEFACADVSFISLGKLARKFAEALGRSSRLIVLVKPQFEAGRSAVERGGVVRDPAAQERAIADVVASFAAAGLRSSKLTYSPIKGPAGNIEFLLGAEHDEGHEPAPFDVAGVVRAAHETLN